MGKSKENQSGFVCGTCVNNDDGFCDFLGIYVESDDAPNCEYGKGWENRYEERS